MLQRNYAKQEQQTITLTELELQNTMSQAWVQQQFDGINALAT